jgi:hypothetical protein
VTGALQARFKNETRPKGQERGMYIYMPFNLDCLGKSTFKAPLLGDDTFVAYLLQAQE